MSWLEYPYPLLGATEAFSNVAVACLLDIGLMKLRAISSRGSKRDFFDVRVICDADSEPQPKMLIDLDWLEVKGFFEEQAKNLVEKGD